VNAFQIEEAIEMERLQVDPTIEAEQQLRLAELRRLREPNRVSELLSQLESTVKSQQNLVPLFIECVESKVTLGEICSVLRKVWGEYQPPVQI